MRSFLTCRNVLFVMAFVPTAGFSQTPTTPDTIWSFVNQLLSQPLEKDSLQRLLGAEPENFSVQDYGLKYNWAGKKFSDGGQAQNFSIVEWRSGRGTEVHIDLSGRCIPISEIEANYPDTKLMALPTHGYPDAVATYMSMNSRGKVSFFINFHTRCLTTVNISSEAARR
jgi:hypothetical protein